MNSFNHYAYGAIGAWLYAVVAGINVDPDRPGYKHIMMRPRPGGDLTRAKAQLHATYGGIHSAWSLANGRFDWQISVPANTTATVCVPISEQGEAWESGQPAESTEGVSFVRRDKDVAIYKVGSGEYHFTVRP